MKFGVFDSGFNFSQVGYYSINKDRKFCNAFSTFLTFFYSFQMFWLFQ